MLRIINILTITASLFVSTLWNVRPEDNVLVVTNPPLLPYLIRVAAKLRRARYHLKIDDIYPDVLVAAGLLSPRSLGAKIWRRGFSWLCQSAETLFVLGRDMEALVRHRVGSRPKICFISNWADNDEIKPIQKAQTHTIRDNGLGDKFVVQVAGNLGIVQGLEPLIEAAAQLTDQHSVCFTFIGSGKHESTLRKRVAQLDLRNVLFLGKRRREEQQDFLNACDIAIVSLINGMEGVSVPSRFYNIMAAGKPILAIMGRECEVAHVVREHQIGWVIDPDDVAGIADAIRSAQKSSAVLAAMGSRSRRLAGTKYSRRLALESYVFELTGSHITEPQS